MEGNYIEDFGNAAGTKTAYGLQATLQGDAASVISGNKVFDFNADSKATRYIYIGVTAVNYGVGELAIVGNSVRGNSRTSDTGLSYSVGNGQGMTLISEANVVLDVGTPRTVGQGVTISKGY